MCKILAVTGPTSCSKAIDIITRTAKSFARTQRDGFGFVALDEDGNGAWGRYYKDFEGWHTTKGALELGEIPPQVWTLIVHGRTSTNVVGVDYCHPYKRGDAYLVHNGVLNYTGPKENRPKHVNDSAALLEWIVGQDYPEPNEWTKNWAGYGAVFMAREDGSLRLVKCSTARLYHTKRRFKGHMFSTDAADIPMEMAKRPDLSPGKVGKVDVTFDTHGDIEHVAAFDGFAEREWDYVCDLSYK